MLTITFCLNCILYFSGVARIERGCRAREIFYRKPHPLIMSLLSLPEGVTTKKNYSTKYSQA